jgi:ribosome-associated translation inhibitor RaiA
LDQQELGINMIIQIHAQDNPRIGADFSEQVQTLVAEKLRRFADRITRVEVFLSDQNGAKSGPDDQRCVIEARLAGVQPVSVKDHHSSPQQAVRGALSKMQHLLDSMLDKNHRH